MSQGVYVYLDTLATPAWVKVDELASYPVVIGEQATPESATPGSGPYEGLPTPEEGDLYTSYSPLELWDYTGGIWVPRDTSLNIPLTNLDYMFNAQTLEDAAGSTVSTWSNEGDAGGAATGTGIMRDADLNGNPGVDFFLAAHSMVLPGTGTIPQPWSMFILFKEKNEIQSSVRVYRADNNTLWSPGSPFTTWQFYVGSSGLDGPTDRSANRTYAMVITANGGILNFYWASATSGGTTYITSSIGAGGFGPDAFDLDTRFFNHNSSPTDAVALGLVGAWGLYSREVSGGEADSILAELMTKWDFTAA